MHTGRSMYLTAMSLYLFNAAQWKKQQKWKPKAMFFTLAPDDKYIRYTMEKAMYLVDETGLAQYNTLKEKGFQFEF